MSRRFRLLAAGAFLAAAFAACDDGANHKEPEPAAAPTGHISYGGGGGGQVSVGKNPQARGSVEERYEKALKSIKERDWDGARAQLLDALKRGKGQEIEKDIQEQLKIVDRGLLSQPTYEVTDLQLHAKEFYEKKVSIRGSFIPGGKVGRVTYYFWVKTKKRQIQARYPKLPLKNKKTILRLKQGAQVLVRGTLKPPWGTNPNPFIELSYFRLERLSPEREAARNKKRGNEEKKP